MKKLSILCLVAILSIALLAASATATNKWEKRRADRLAEQQSSNITTYSLPATQQERVARESDKYIDTDAVPTQRSAQTSSLGVADGGAVSSPGMAIRSTREDWQYSVKGRYMGYSTTVPSIQFGYTDLQTDDATNRGFGYNVYNPVGTGNWPRGLGVGCRVQATDTEGRWVTSAVLPDGKFVFAGEDFAPGYADNHFYANTSLHGCFWGGGSIIPRTQYIAGFVDTTNNLTHPVIDVVLSGTDTVYHCVAHSSGFQALAPGYSITGPVIQYFRKVNGGMVNATWTGPVTIDTGNYRGVINASRSGNNKVVVAYVHHTQKGIDENNGDYDIYYRESTDAGASWPNPPVNLTNYDRSVASYNPWIEVQPMYDSQGDLHIIWNANPLPADVYNDPTWFWGDFTCALLHWSSKTGSVSRVANREYGIAWNTQVCGFGGTNSLYLAFFNIAECNGRLYVTYSGWNDVFGTGTIDDCASSFFDAPNRVFQANGEIYMHVSAGLDGLLWDAARNITNTYTPLCDSAGYGGICMNDTKVMMAAQGFDSAGYGQALTFPTSELVVVDPTYAGSQYLNLFYMVDHIPGHAALGGRGTVFSDNELNWMRIGCIDPISASQIAYTPTSIGYPTWMHHGDSIVVTVTVVNDGNEALNVTTIGEFEEDPVTDWMYTTETSLAVPAGTDNTRSFDVVFNGGGTINSPGTIVALNGEVYMLTNAPAPRDSVSYFVNDLLIVDTVVGLAFDTIATTLTMLVTDNHGTIGNGGSGGTNLDYSVLGGECDANATVYLFDGGPYVIQDQGSGNYAVSHGMHQSGGLLNQNAFKPVFGAEWAVPAHLTGGNYDGAFSGSFVNWDTTIACEYTAYAPTGGGDSANFVVMKYDFFSADGNPHNNLVFGSSHDWDIPSITGSNNNAYVNASGTVVYFQGTDTLLSGTCQDHSTRFGAEGFLGWYTNTEYNSDACSNTKDIYGQYGARNDSDRFTPDDTEYAEFLWNKTALKAGFSGIAEATDIHGVTTFAHNMNLGANDTLTFYTVLATVHSGIAADVDASLIAACAWYDETLRAACGVCGCCVGLTGNVDNDPNDIVDIGDLTALINYLFIPPFPVPVCMDEANADGTGSVDIGDLTALINYLFIPPFPLPAGC